MFAAWQSREAGGIGLNLPRPIIVMASSRLRGLLEALLVTFLWSSSYVLTKVGLRDTSPLLLVALRYLVASAVLVPVALARGAHRGLDRGTLARLALLGLSGYAGAQGPQG